MPTRDLASLHRGAVLLEGLIAILIFSFGILALVGLQASSMKATSSAKSRVDASLIANQRIAAMWADRNNLASYVETDQALDGLPNGKRTTAVMPFNDGSLVTITVSWQMPGKPLDKDESIDTYQVTTDIAAN
jgi:type IV pilus assembly protein PilV